MTRRRESVGRKGLNLVTIYERTKNGPIQVEYWNPERVQESLASLAGKPVYDWDLALRIALRLSERLAAGSKARTARVVLGMQQPRTLSELFHALHEKKGPGWKPDHRKEQERMRAFWLATLGAERVLPVTPAECEEVVSLAARAKGWSVRSQQKALAYIKQAVTFAETKLKWIGPESNLSALDIPQPDTDNTELSYSSAEVARLLTALTALDVRAGLVGEIAYATGRRQTAIRTLPRSAFRWEAVEVGDDVVDVPVVRFPAETDKASKTGRAVLSEEAVALIEAVRERWPDSPWLIPSADGKRPMRERGLYDLLLQAETNADVPHVTGRGFHGLKRRGVTDIRKATGSMGAARGQSGTTRQTLERIYDQADLDEQVEAVRALKNRRVKQGKRDIHRDSGGSND